MTGSKGETTTRSGSSLLGRTPTVASAATPAVTN
jgi:hypothetical protein